MGKAGRRPFPCPDKNSAQRAGPNRSRPNGGRQSAGAPADWRQFTNTIKRAPLPKQRAGSPFVPLPGLEKGPARSATGPTRAAPTGAAERGSARRLAAIHKHDQASTHAEPEARRPICAPCSDKNSAPRAARQARRLAVFPNHDQASTPVEPEARLPIGAPSPHRKKGPRAARRAQPEPPRQGRQRAGAPPYLRFILFAIRSSTTSGSASVDVSPRAPKSSSATLRRMRRMILPERVFGRPGAH